MSLFVKIIFYYIFPSLPPSAEKAFPARAEDRDIHPGSFVRILSASPPRPCLLHVRLSSLRFRFVMEPYGSKQPGLVKIRGPTVVAQSVGPPLQRWIADNEAACSGGFCMMVQWMRFARHPTRLDMTLGVEFRQGKLDEADALFSQVFFFAPGGGPPDVSPVFFSVMNPQGDLRKLSAHIVKVLSDILLEFLQDL
jgi:hypothetical protein